MSSAVAAFKLVDKGGAPPSNAHGRSRTMASPRTPIIVNGVVFALAGGNAGANAVLYALDPATGKELWNSGNTITSTASAGMSAGTGQVYVVTSDNTVWHSAFPWRLTDMKACSCHYCRHRRLRARRIRAGHAA